MDPFNTNSQPLTDALLQLDRAISLAESNVSAAQQVGLPEASDLAYRLPPLTMKAREFLATVPDMGQPQRWGEARRLLDQARSFQPFFAPYLALGPRVVAQRQALLDHAARQKAAQAQALHARMGQDVGQGYDLARRRFSSLRQTFADMQMQRGPGFDDPGWQEAVRAVASIAAAQEVRIAAAAANLRDNQFEEAQAQLDQALGELQAALDLAQRARVAAGMRARTAAVQAGRTTIPMPTLAGGVAGGASPSGSLAPFPVPPVRAAIAPPRPSGTATALLLIEARTGTLFRCDGRPTVLGRGQDPTGPQLDPYLNLSRACDPGEAEDLGISRRHAEIGRQEIGFLVRDLGSTNGTRLRHAGHSEWQSLTPQQWVTLQEGDTVQLGLLDCTVSLS